MRKSLVALTVLVLGAGSASAQTGAWADKIFLAGGGKTSHDFGTVARGAQLVHAFKITNIYSVPLEITNIRATCGCLTATPSTRVLRPQETAQLNIVMDGRRFSGHKSINVYVTVGPEYVSTATLHVTANARPDVVLNPGQFNFGVVRQGQRPTQTLDVEYAGNFDWAVTEVVKTAAAPYDVVVEQLYRQPARSGQPGRVGYRLAVTLKPDTPPGPLHHELILKTNEPGTNQYITVVVEGNVQATLTVTPGVIVLGKVKAGTTTTQKVQVRGQRPFRILGVDGAGDGIEAVLPTGPAQNHVLLLRCQPNQAGDLRRQLTIRTDLDQSAGVTVNLEATVTP
ncbi:MAG: DUF1573 domain-containing protein [Gemmataceae bacterium]|nr:DUF1573 domain-containing protein [Gemmataceae bacterium]